MADAVYTNICILPASQRTTRTGCAIACQMATLLSDRTSNAAPFFAFNSHSRFAAFHFETVATAPVESEADVAFAAAALGAAVFEATGFAAAVEEAIGVAGAAADRNMANVSVPPAMTSRPA